MKYDGHKFQRTPAGEQVLASGDTAIPSDYRRLLAAIHPDTHYDVIRGRLRQYSDKLIGEWLSELEELGFIRAEPLQQGDPFDLDFTEFFDKPAAAASVIAEDKAKLERAAKQAGDALTKTGAYLSQERQKNRPPLRKDKADTVVLIVEDDPDQLSLADLRVTMAGYSVRVATDARSLVETLRKDSKVDILLLDVMLPDGNGFEILAKMRSHPKLALLPIILLTAMDEPGDIKKGLATGADGYVTKPYSKTILADTIRTVLKQSA